MRLIDADELTASVKKWLPEDPCGRVEKEMPFETDICVSMLMEIEEAETVDAEPVVHAHWIRLEYMDSIQYKYIECSRCGRITAILQNHDTNDSAPYCHCGAKMDEEADSD